MLVDALVLYVLGLGWDIGGTYSLLVILVNLSSETLLIVGLVLQAESVVLKSVTGLDALLGSLVLIGVLLGLLNHAVNLLLSETSLIVGDGDGLDLASTLVGCGDLENSVCVKPVSMLGNVVVTLDLEI